MPSLNLPGMDQDHQPNYRGEFKDLDLTFRPWLRTPTRDTSPVSPTPEEMTHGQRARTETGGLPEEV